MSIVSKYCTDKPYNSKITVILATPDQLQAMYPDEAKKLDQYRADRHWARKRQLDKRWTINGNRRY